MSKSCTRCDRNLATTSIVAGDVYFKDICRVCKAVLAPVKVNSGHARWARDIDIMDHEADIQQPYNSDGSINVKFARLYPRQANALFTVDQLRKANL